MPVCRNQLQGEMRLPLRYAVFGYISYVIYPYLILPCHASDYDSPVARQGTLVWIRTDHFHQLAQRINGKNLVVAPSLRQCVLKVLIQASHALDTRPMIREWRR